jgi:hypothetical protein
MFAALGIPAGTFTTTRLTARHDARKKGGSRKVKPENKAKRRYQSKAMLE